MGLGKYLKKYKEYETRVLKNRVSAHRSRVAEKREYKTALKKSIESARRKAYEQEAIKQAGIRARLSAQRQYGMFSGFVKPKIAVVKKQPKKHHKRKIVKRKRRMMVRYVYR